MSRHPRIGGMIVPLKFIRDAADRIEAELDTANAAFDRQKGDDYGEQFHAAMDRLKAHNRRIAKANGVDATEAWDGARVRHLGISSTSTSGLGGALRNWVKAARRRLEELEADPTPGGGNNAR